MNAHIYLHSQMNNNCNTYIYYNTCLHYIYFIVEWNHQLRKLYEEIVYSSLHKEKNSKFSNNDRFEANIFTPPTHRIRQYIISRMSDQDIVTNISRPLDRRYYQLVRRFAVLRQGYLAAHTDTCTHLLVFTHDLNTRSLSLHTRSYTHT